MASLRSSHLVDHVGDPVALAPHLRSTEDTQEMGDQAVGRFLICRNEPLELFPEKFVLRQAVGIVVDQTKRIVANSHFQAKVGFICHCHSHDISPPADDSHLGLGFETGTARLDINHPRANRPVEPLDQPGDQAIGNGWRDGCQCVVVECDRAEADVIVAGNNGPWRKIFTQ